MMHFVTEDLVEISPDRDSTVGATLDFKSIDDIVTPVNINPLVAIGGVLTIDDRSAFDLGFQHDRTGRAPACAQVKSPAAGVVRIHPGQYVDSDARGGNAVGACERPERLRRCSRTRSAALRAHVIIS